MVDLANKSRQVVMVFGDNVTLERLLVLRLERPQQDEKKQKEVEWPHK